MYRVQLVFDLINPDSEDQQVRDYLAQHELEPRHQANAEVEGRQCQVMLFGGCYLGPHLEQIGKLQRRAVEVELLAEELQRHLSAGAGLPFASDGQRKQLVEALVPQFQQEENFRAGESGGLSVALDGDLVRQAARRWLEGGAGDGNRTHVTSLEG